MTETSRTQSNKNLKELFISGIFTILVIAVISFAAAILCSFNYKNSGDLKLYSFAALILAGLLTGFINSKRNGMKTAVFTALFVSLILLLIGIIITGGKIGFGAIMNYLCFFLLSVAGAYIGRKKERRHRRKRR